MLVTDPNNVGGAGGLSNANINNSMGGLNGGLSDGNLQGAAGLSNGGQGSMGDLNQQPGGGTGNFGF